MSQFWKKKIVLFALESVYGTDATPVATDGVLLTDLSLMPMEGTDETRDLELPYLGAQGSVATELHMKTSFKVELAPSGTAGVAPKWSQLLRACSVAETIIAGTSVTYNPITDAQESGSMYIWIDSTLYVSKGMRGNCKFAFTAQKIPYLEFEMTGLFTLPSEQARVTPDLTGYQKPEVFTDAKSTFALDGSPMVLRNLSLDLGNSVDTSFLIGEELVDITDKAEAVEMTVKAVPLSTFDPYAAALSDNNFPLVLTHGKTVGGIATLEIDQLELQRPQGLENANGKVEWPLRGLPLPTSGNDQWTLTLT